MTIFVTLRDTFFFRLRRSVFIYINLNNYLNNYLNKEMILFLFKLLE